MFNIKKKFNMFAFGRVTSSIVVVALLVVWALAIQRTNDSTIQGIEIDVNSVEGMKDMIVEDEMLDILQTVSSVDIMLSPIRKLDIRKLEKAIRDDNRIHDAQIFIDARQVLNVDIEQRRPILRIKAVNGQDYYLDQAGSYVSKTQDRTVRVPVVTGHIDKYQADWKLNQNNKINHAYDIGMIINNNSFLRSLIEQIHFERSGRIVMIPKVGEHKIVLNYADDIETKLTKNLRVFYKEMAQKNLWYKYDELDISYSKQVVGRKLSKP